MAAYVIAQVNITDRERFKRFQALVPKSLEQYGGRYLAPGPGGEMIELEGSWPDCRTVVLEFGSLERARAWYDSPGFKEALAARGSAATFNMIAVQGL